MDKVAFESQIKIDSLGKWQGKILDAIRQHLKGADSRYAILPFGRAGLVIYWDGFKGLPPAKRQETVRKAIETLGPGVVDRVSISLTLTNDEAAELDKSYAGLMQTAGLENAPPEQVELYAAIRKRLNAFAASWYNIIEGKLFVSGWIENRQQTISFSNIFAKRWAALGLKRQSDVIGSILGTVVAMKAADVSVNVDEESASVLLEGHQVAKKLNLL
jgi:hypothetical protein